MVEPMAASGRRSEEPVLLYDGVCSFCNRSVSFILRQDRVRPGVPLLRFAALESALGAEIIGRHPELAGVDSVVWVEPRSDGSELVLVRSDAALRVARYLGPPWSFAAVARVIPRPVRDALYDLFARWRYRIFGKLDACRLPPPEWRARFLDLDERVA